MSGNGSSEDEYLTSSEDEEYDMLMYVVPIFAAAAAYAHLYMRRPVRRPLHNSAHGPLQRAEELLHSHPTVIHNKIRMNAGTFLRLANKLETRGLLRSTRRVSVKEQLFMFLTILAQGVTVRDSEDAWQRSGETICRWFKVVLKAVYKLRYEYIRTASTDGVHPWVNLHSNKYRPWFDNCVGAIDGTHVDCHPPAAIKERYGNRHWMLSMNILVVCSFDMRFTYIVSGWEGSAHDARVLTKTLADDRNNFPIPDAGKFYLADSGYGLKEGFLTPYKDNVLYHVNEYRRRGSGPRGKEELFNYTHSSLRNVIERTFGIWKKRFPILKQMRAYKLKTQVRIPIVCAILHNFIIQDHEVDRLIEEYMDILDFNTHTDSQQHPVYNADDHIGSSEQGSSPMERFRASMTDYMWSVYPSRPWARNP